MTANQQTIAVKAVRSARTAEQLRTIRRFMRIGVVVLVVCFSFLFENTCFAGMIVPVAADLQQNLETWIRTPQNAVIIETGTGLGDHDATPIHGRLQSHRVLNSEMLAEPAGCGAPSPVAGTGSSGWLAAVDRTMSGLEGAFKLSGRVITEFNLLVPAVAPSELLDPPRVNA